MATIQLPRNVHFIYEHSLAHLELTQGYRLSPKWDMADPWKMTAPLNGEAAEILERAAYVGSIDGQESVYSQLVRPSYRGGEFNRTRSENQYLTHWIYPYKGKFHPQMVRAILNILGARPGWTVLDPFSGSGTTVLECQLLGVDAIGVEISPLCAMLARVKTQSWCHAQAIAAAVQALTREEAADPERVSASQWQPREVADFVEIARMVTFSDVSRRRRRADVYFGRNLRAMLQSVEDMARAIERFQVTPGRVDVHDGDCRDLASLGIGPGSIDAVVTSPPYSIALDYVENDEHALRAMGLDTDRIRERFIGVRGTGATQKAALYQDDMRHVLSELARVLRPAGHAVVVIGNATIQHRECLTTEHLIEWAERVGLRLVRQMPKIVWGLYNLVKDEKILFFRRD